MTGKERYLRKLNEAYANSNSDYIIAQVTDDIVWNVVGEAPVVGKEAFARTTRAMETEIPLEMTVDSVITHGNKGALNGTIRMKADSGEKTYAFCDIYRLSGSKNRKVSSITSYVIETTPSNA